MANELRPYPGERREDDRRRLYQFPSLGAFTRIRGLVSTTYLRRGETMVVRWTDFWAEMALANYIDIAGMIEEPAATEYFPTMAEVWNLIEHGATTLPGEKILAVRADKARLYVRAGVSMDSSREFAVEWPDLESILSEVVVVRDDIQHLSQAARGSFDAAVAALRDELISYNGIASAAAEIALDAAEEAKASAGESGKSAYEIAVLHGFDGSEEEWLRSLTGPEGTGGAVGPQGPVGPEGPRGEQGPVGPAGPEGPKGEKGEDGKSVSIAGAVANKAALPEGLGVPDAGRGWMTQDDGHLHIWSGTEWVDVGQVRGPRGLRGQTGAAGDPGVQGPPGPEGQRGPVGPQGPAGARGEPGERGEQGERGLQGPQGPEGQRGPAGVDGTDGAGFLIAGTAASVSSLPLSPTLGDAYILDDGTAVQYTGSGWSRPVAFRGPSGPKGERGETGPRGPTGPKGDTGARGEPGTNGRDGRDYTPPGWQTGQCSVHDNGSIGLGSGGYQHYKWRVDRGVFELFFEVRWGSRPSSHGGSVKINLPYSNSMGIEAVGSGSYWSAGGQFSMAVTPSVKTGQREILFLVNHHGGTTVQKEFRIWDGRNGHATGIPGNPDFFIDHTGSALMGHIRFIVGS